MNQTALELGESRSSLVTSVACHPTRDIVAMGQADGQIRIGHLATGQQRTLREGGSGAINSMAWQRDGRFLVYGTSRGECGSIEFLQQNSLLVEEINS